MNFNSTESIKVSSPFHRWLRVSRPESVESQDYQTTTHSGYERLQVKLNKWTNEIVSKFVAPMASILSIGVAYQALTTATLSHNFEIQSAPQIPIFLASAAIGLLSGVLSVFSHQEARAWRTIDNWMGTNSPERVNLTHPGTYWDRFHW